MTSKTFSRAGLALSLLASALSGCAAPRVPHGPIVLPASAPPHPANPRPEAAPEAPREGWRQDAAVPPTTRPLPPNAIVAPRLKINIALERAPIAAAADAVLGEALGRSFRVDPGVQGEVSIRLVGELTEAEILAQFDQALRASGAALAGGVGGGVAIVPVRSAPTFSSISPGDGSPVAYLTGGLAVYQARNIGAAELAKLLEPLAEGGARLRADPGRQQVYISGSPAMVGSLARAAAIFDVDWLAGRSVQFYPMRRAAAKAVADDLQKVMGGASGPVGSQVEVIVVDRLNALILTAKSPELLDQTLSWVQRLDQPAEPSDRRLRVVRLTNLASADFAKTLSELFARAPIPGTVVGPNRARSDGAITADERSNSILMFADDAEYQSVLEIVRQLDVPAQQIMIEATIAEVTLNNQLKYGVQAFLDGGKLTGGLSASDTAAGASGFPGLSLRYLNGDFRAALNALSTVTDVELISTPRILVTANETATLQVGDQVPIITQSSQATDTSNARIVNSVAYRDTGVVLTVTARVGEGGRIFIDIAQEVSDVTDTITSGIDSPTIQQRRFNTHIQVDDGQVVALGGLLRSSKTRGATGLPVLSRAPIIGGLFGQTTRNDRQTELVVFLKPQLVETRSEADRITDEISARIKALGFGRAGR